MEIQNQIRKYRKARGFPQEELAEKIFVSRQTISNWENAKSCPDVHSLLLLSALFDVSLDALIKGDLDTMKKEISTAQRASFSQAGKIFSLLFLASLLAFVPLVVFFKLYGFLLWGILYLITLAMGFKVEAMKKQHDLHTCKEIVAFSEGRTLDEIQTQREIGKQPCQAVLKPLAGAAAGLLVTVLALLLLQIMQ